MHQDIRHLQSCYSWPHFGIEVASGDVVDNIGFPVGYASACDIGTESVDGNECVGVIFAYCLKSTSEARIFFIGRDLGSPGARRVSADVDDVAP